MKNKIQNEKAITLITLVVAVSIMIIIASMLIYNAKTGIKMRNLKMMQNDIDLLDNKVDAYYVKYGALPAEIEYKVTPLPFESYKSPNDNDKYYVLDLNAFEGLTLNYGADFTSVTAENVANYTDIYVINEQSHHIYYVRGIEMDGVWYHTNDIDEDITLKSSIIFNIIDSNTSNLVKNLTILGIYTDESCTNLLDNINISNGTAQYTDLEKKVYYIKMSKAPDGYNLPTDIITIDMSNKIFDKIIISVKAGTSLPSSGGYLYAEIDDFSNTKNTTVTISVTDPYGGTDLKLYKIGDYLESTGTYEITSELKSLGLTNSIFSRNPSNKIRQNETAVYSTISGSTISPICEATTSQGSETFMNSLDTDTWYLLVVSNNKYSDYIPSHGNEYEIPSETFLDYWFVCFGWKCSEVGFSDDDTKANMYYNKFSFTFDDNFLEPLIGPPNVTLNINSYIINEDSLEVEEYILNQVFPYKVALFLDSSCQVPCRFYEEEIVFNSSSTVSINLNTENLSSGSYYVALVDSTNNSISLNEIFLDNDGNTVALQLGDGSSNCFSVGNYFENITLDMNYVIYDMASP